MVFDAITLRVLGSLMEKEMTTPENYPLSLNALVNACNQRSSREPVMDLPDDEVLRSLHQLQSIEWVSAVRDARVPKYEHRVRTVLQLRRDETAVMCLLLLRGPQTAGELRSRADRMFAFDDLAAVQSALDRLGSRSPSESPADESAPLAMMLPRQPGSSASRWMHLLGGPPPPATEYVAASNPVGPMRPRDRTAELEARVAELEVQVAELRALMTGQPQSMPVREPL